MSARDDLAKAAFLERGFSEKDWNDDPFARASWIGHASSAIHLVKAAGYRILAPGELDAETVERCAQVAQEEIDIFREMYQTASTDNHERVIFASRAFGAAIIRDAIRSLDTEG